MCNNVKDANAEMNQSKQELQDTNKQEVCQCFAAPSLPKYLYHATNQADADLIKTSGLGGSYIEFSRLENRDVTKYRPVWFAGEIRGASGKGGVTDVIFEVEANIVLQLGEIPYQYTEKGVSVWKYIGKKPIPAAQLKLVKGKYTE